MGADNDDDPEAGSKDDEDDATGKIAVDRVLF